MVTLWAEDSSIPRDWKAPQCLVRSKKQQPGETSRKRRERPEEADDFSSFKGDPNGAGKTGSEGGETEAARSCMKEWRFRGTEVPATGKIVRSARTIFSAWDDRVGGSDLRVGRNAQVVVRPRVEIDVVT